MKSIEWYKEKFKTDSMNLVVHSDGKIEVPLWLVQYILRSRGLKSKKKRIIKKILTRELNEIFIKALKEEKIR